MLKELCKTSGVSGYESRIGEFIMQFIKDNCQGDTYIDGVGNVNFHCNSNCGNSKILFVAHMDEVGFQIIKSIEKNKFAFKTLGNIKMWNINQQMIQFYNGELGIIYSSDELNIKAHNYNNMYVEVLNENANINIGDKFTFYSDFIEGEDYIYGKAIDNRVGCYCLLRALEKREFFKNDIYVTFTTQEEISMRGVRVAISSIVPDIIVSVDVSPIGKNNSLEIGSGVGIKISDSIGISDEFLVKKTKDIADMNSVSYQMEVSDCGTSELIISNEFDKGSRNIGISIPCEHMHTPYGKVNKNDIKSCIQLLKLMIDNILLK